MEEIEEPEKSLLEGTMFWFVQRGRLRASVVAVVVRAQARKILFGLDVSRSVGVTTEPEAQRKAARQKVVARDIIIIVVN